MMLSFVKNSVLWQFAVGFAIGAMGLVALHPSEAKATTAPAHLVR